MLLRQLVTQWARHTAQQKLYQAVSDTAQKGQPYSGESGIELPKCDIVIAFGLGVESGGTVDLLQEAASTRCASFVEHSGNLQGHRVAVVETGVGRQAALKAIDDIVALHHPSWIISAGFAGALRPEIRRGHILMPDEVVDVGHHRVEIDLHIDRETAASSRGLHIGRLLTVDQLIQSSEDKRRLGEEHDALACDMETMTIAEACRRKQIRFLAVRVVSDALDDELPHEIERMLNQKSLAAKLGAATGALFNRPSSIKDMWKLKEDALKASDRLAKFLAGLIAQL